jgi:hypothetical protein
MRELGKKDGFNFLEINESDLIINSQSSLISKIKNKELDGIILKKVLTKDEVKESLGFLEKLDVEDLMTTPSGTIFPKPFAIINKDEPNKTSEYFESIKRLERHSEKDTSILILFNKLKSALEKIGFDFKVEQAINKVRNEKVNYGTYRVLETKKGGLYVHCGNYFQNQSLYYYSLLKDVSRENQLSFFIMLQNTEEGGELTLYNIYWDQVEQKDNPQNNEYLLDKENNKVYIKDYEYLKLKPEEGDLLVFSGGRIWHRVEDILGKSDRVTFGGFLNFSTDLKSLYFWS